jgi:carbamoyl-phosphate synthase/aspartate carbamoyltransferase
MAVDLAIPLITNIKCAKLFVSAISRRPKFEVSTVDCQTSHVTYILPGLVNVSPVQMMPGVALKAGITFLANTPSEKQFYADFSLSTQDVNRYGASLLITESNLGIAFKEWKGKFISTAEYLSSVLLYSNLYEKAVHITQVSNFEDLQLILLSKEKGVNVTFDVDIYDLFSNQFLWDYFDEIDCLSIGKEQECAVLLLLNAVRDKKIKMEDISEKMSANPRKIFDIPEQHDTFIEVELDAATTTPGQRRFGSVHRVVMHGKTGFHFLTQVFLSGELFGECAGLQEPHTPLLAMQSPHKRVSVPPASPVRYPAVSTDKGPRTRLFSDSNAGHRSEGAVEVRRQSIPSFTVPSYSRMATPTFSKKHIISVNQFQRSDLHILFGVAEEMKLSVEKQGKLSMLDGKVMCSAFWEPSTRTSCSFETAMVRLGGSVISINQITSSISKGESLSDTGNFISDDSAYTSYLR